MAAIRPLEQSAERWAKGTMRHGVEVARHMASMANMKKVLWMVAPWLRAVNYRSKKTAAITLPCYLLRHLGAEHGDMITCNPGPGRTVVLRLARADEIAVALDGFRQYDVESRKGLAA